MGGKRIVGQGIGLVDCLEIVTRRLGSELHAKSAHAGLVIRRQLGQHSCVHPLPRPEPIQARPGRQRMRLDPKSRERCRRWSQSLPASAPRRRPYNAGPVDATFAALQAAVLQQATPPRWLRACEPWLAARPEQHRVGRRPLGLNEVDQVCQGFPLVAVIRGIFIQRAGHCIGRRPTVRRNGPGWQSPTFPHSTECP